MNSANRSSIRRRRREGRNRLRSAGERASSSGLTISWTAPRSAGGWAFTAWATNCCAPTARPRRASSSRAHNLVFDRLPADHDLIKLVYAEGSQSGYGGRTVFAYIVTNVAQGGMAREEFLDASQIAPGDYTLRVFAEDFFGNQARRDTPIIVTNPK